MRFGKACIVAASVGYGANAADAAGLDTVLKVFEDDFLSSTAFYKNLLLNMQRNTGDVSTSCMTGYDSFLTLYTDLSEELKTDVTYYAALKDKGQANGSSIGF